MKYVQLWPFNKALYHGLWDECARNATLLNKSDFYNVRNTPRHTIFNKIDSLVFNLLDNFSEVTTVTLRTKIKIKLQNQGQVCPYLGRYDDHASNV